MSSVWPQCDRCFANSNGALEGGEADNKALDQPGELGERFGMTRTAGLNAIEFLPDGAEVVAKAAPGSAPTDEDRRRRATAMQC